MSPHCADNLEKVFSIKRMTCDRKPTDDLTDLDVNTVLWCKYIYIYIYIYIYVTLQAAVHTGQENSQNRRSINNQPSKSVKQLFRTTE